MKSGVRPVPLEYAYYEIPLPHTIEKLVDEGKTPAYVVHFTQADAASSAQDFTSLKICSREQKAEIAARDRQLRASAARMAPTCASGCGTGSASITRGCCRSIACWSSSWRSSGC